MRVTDRDLYSRINSLELETGLTYNLDLTYGNVNLFCVETKSRVLYGSSKKDLYNLIGAYLDIKSNLRLYNKSEEVHDEN